MIGSRRGVSLVAALVVIVLVESFGIVALGAVAARARLGAARRWSAEGEVVADGALASIAVGGRADLDTLSDGGAIAYPAVSRPDGWRWEVAASRRGGVVRLIATATRYNAAGALAAARTASLLLIRRGADTVRVLAQQPRF
ncbi:MAG: hypothetical protein ACREL5_04465 [Gemmatimonadales bacterium]